MQAVSFEHVTVDRCTHCFGIWFDALELQKIVALRGGRTLDIGSREMGKQMDEANRIDCPHCRAQMLRLVNDRHPEVHYEQCAVCGGAFLDAGELKTIESRTMSDILFDLLGL
jgi:Zn-finger nucleic acid-binding protein